MSRHQKIFLIIFLGIISMIKTQNGCVEPDSVNKCTECVSGFYLKYGNCFNCDEKCKTCSSKESCDSCNKGDYLNLSSKTCLKCENNCHSCLDEQLCMICKNDFILENGRCLQILKSSQQISDTYFFVGFSSGIIILAFLIKCCIGCEDKQEKRQFLNEPALNTNQREPYRASEYYGNGIPQEKSKYPQVEVNVKTQNQPRYPENIQEWPHKNSISNSFKEPIIIEENQARNQNFYSDNRQELPKNNSEISFPQKPLIELNFNTQTKKEDIVVLDEVPKINNENNKVEINIYPKFDDNENKGNTFNIEASLEVKNQ